MADLQPVTYTPISYTPLYQLPGWRDDVDLVAAGTPNGFNAQFRNLKDEFNALSRTVQQLSTALSAIVQALNATEAAVIAANTTANTANATANIANTTATTATATANAAKASADEAKKKASDAMTWVATLQPVTTLNFRNDGAYIAWCNVTYTDIFGQPQKWDGGQFPNPQTRSVQIPAGSKDIVINSGAIAGDMIIDKKALPQPVPQNVTKNIYLKGGTKNTSYEGL